MYRSKINNQRKSSARRGIVIPLMAILIPAILVLMVMAVDFGTINLARQQLQNAADASAVATLDVLLRDPNAADQAGVETVNNNLLLGEPIPLNAIRAIDYGTWDADTRTFVAFQRDGGNPPAGATAVRVTIERSRNLQNAVPLFLGSVIGIEFADVTVEAVAAAEAACVGFVGIESVTLANNIITDSYNSDEGDYTPWSDGNRNDNGDICSGGPVHLSSGADVFGDAQGAPVTVAPGSGATISGTRTNIPSVVDFPPVDFTEVLSNNNSNIARGPVWAPPFFDPDSRNLVVNNGRSLTLSEGVYHFNDLLLAGGSRLNITGPVQIYIEGEMRFDNGTVANQTQLPANMQIFVGEGPVNIQGGHQLHASIYAPEADVNMANGSGFFGSVIGKTFSTAGGAGLHYDESLSTETAAGASPALVW